MKEITEKIETTEINKIAVKPEKNKPDWANSKALFVLKIITMSFAILACIVIATAMLTRWIMDLNRKVKESNSKIARAAARLNKFRKERIKHILKQRKLQLKEEKEEKKRKEYDKNRRLAYIENEDDDADELEDLAELDEIDDIDDLSDEENAINDFDNELGDIMLDDIDEI